MNSKDKETLSQLMDGEWQDLNADECVKAACADDALRATWSRYHLVRDVIRNDDIAINSALTSRISSAIADEPTYSNVSSINVSHKDQHGAVHDSSQGFSQSNPAQEARLPAEPVKRRGSVLSGFAVAACVALATLIGLNVWQGAPNGDANLQAVAGSGLTSGAQANLPGVTLPEVEFVANRGTFWVTPESKRSPAMEKRLNALLSQHIEASPTAERTGMLPYSRLVGYDSVTPGQ